MTYEFKIRDYLADHLDRLEQELSLIQKEFPLNNPLGSSGKVDILARDKYGLHVIIEIKRSNQASRQALHELHKYVALYQTNMGISSSEIRCIIISTTWHELLVPFSEYFYSSVHSVEGYEIKVDVNGKILESKKIEPIKTEDELKLCPEHSVYLFDTQLPIKTAVNQCFEGLNHLGIKDFCILEIAYNGQSKAVIYPYGIYVVISAFNKTEKAKHANKYDIDPSEYSPDESPFFIEETLLSNLSKFIAVDYSYEIGYPEKFTSIMENWKVLSVHRYGRLKKSEKIIEDFELLQMISGFKGQNAYYYQGFSTPAHKKHWNSAVENSKYTLIGNNDWIKIIDWFSSSIELLSTRSEVSFIFFNPSNIIGSLYKFYNTGQPSYLPHFEIVVVSEDGTKTCLLSGHITWDGTVVDKNIETIIKPFFMDPFDFLISMHQGSVYEYDSLIMKRIGLRYSQYLVKFIDGKRSEISSISIENGEVLLNDADAFSNKTIKEYISKNKEFILSLCNMIDSKSHGF